MLVKLNKTIVLLILGLLVNTEMLAQDFGLYSMSNLQQSLAVNPAHQLNDRIYIGIPGISSIGFNGINTVGSPKDMFESNGDRTTLRVDNLEKIWGKRNYIGASASIELISFAFSLNDMSYLSFTAKENVFARINLPKDLLMFPLQGNGNFDETEGLNDFSGLSVNASHYRSYGVGYQRKINNQWTLGAKVKFLQGLTNVDTKESSLKLRTDPTTYDITVEGKYSMRSSGFDTTGNAQAKDFLMRKGNYGLGLDLGATYKVNEKLTLSASIIDLGFIRWKTSNMNFVSNDVEIIYTGIDFSEAIFSSDTMYQDDIDDQYEDYGDEFNTQFSENNGNNDKYATALVSKIYIGASYNIIDHKVLKGDAGALFFGEFYKGRLRPSLTLSYTQNLSRYVQATVNYTLLDKRSNLGAGISLGLGPVQIHAIVDNMLMFNLAELRYNNKDNQEKSLTVFPYSARNFQFRVGINVAIGAKKVGHVREEE